MKYWEAMLKGSKLRPQAFGGMYDGSGSCAIGAMFEALCGKVAFETCNADAWYFVRELSDKFGKKDCPVCHVNFDFGTVLWHLNDIHEWSRENTAYFLRSVEEPVRGSAEKPVNVEEKGYVQTVGV